MIKVLLVDDQKLFVQSLKAIIELNADDIKVKGIAINGNEAVKLCRELSPDVILMDVYMPEMNGVEATKIIHDENPNVRIMMLSTFDKDQYVSQALSYGANGYLLKDISPSELIASIRALHQGDGTIQISPHIAEKLVTQISKKKSVYVDNSSVQKKYESLSNREKEVFHCIARGMDNRSTAEELFIAEQTVRNYVHIIYEKFGVESRFDIIQMTKYYLDFLE